MAKLKLHAKRHLSYDPQTEGQAWVLCGPHVPQSQIAASEPTCKKCLAALKWREENERDWAARRKPEVAR